MNNRDIIKFTLDANPRKVQTTFNTLVSRRISDTIEVKKAEVGANLIQRVNDK